MNKALNIFIGGIALDSHREEIRSKSKAGLQNAPNLFQEALVDGLRSNLDNLTLLNLPFIGSWPINYTSPFAPKSFKTTIQNSENKSVEVVNRTFLNPTYFKMLTRQRACYNALKNILKKNAGYESVNIFIYSVHLPFLKAAIKIKNRFSNVKVFDIIPDLPEFKTDNATGLKGWLLNYDTHVEQEIYDSMDGFILLTKEMANRVVKNGQPYTVIEGIYRKKDGVENNGIDSNTIVYTGTLDQRYNIMNLVEAFMQIDNPDLRLVICGRGNSAQAIREAAKKDPRIDYKGELSYDEIVKIQNSAALLVNPRTADGDFTSYSFPSKTMEYLASGTPTLIYRLPGIPDEYYEHCYSLDNNDVASLRDKIKDIFNAPVSERKQMGCAARDFILTMKSPARQCSKIKELNIKTQ